MLTFAKILNQRKRMESDILEIKCVRCKKKLNERRYLIQTIVYLGTSSKRMDLCPECFDDFRDWLEEMEGNEE